MNVLRAGVAVLAVFPQLALAADFDGRQLAPLWGVPFAGLLLSIALMPLLTPGFWHHHFGKVSAAWALAFLLPFDIVRTRLQMNSVQYRYSSILDGLTKI